MALDATARRKVFRDFAKVFNDPATPATITKTDLIAAVGGIDDYFDANAVAMNQAIPQPARGALSAGQKALLFSLVAMARYGG